MNRGHHHHRPPRLPRSLTVASIASLAALTAACSTFSSDGGFDTVARVTRDRLDKDVRRIDTESQRDGQRERIDALLDAGTRGQTLSADDAVQIALWNHRGLQAEFQELGLSEADLVQAGRLPNPRFSMLRARRGGDYKIEQALTFDVMALLVMPLATDVERARFQRTQQRVSLAVLQHAAATRRAWLLAVAANERLRYRRQAEQAAAASAELAAGMKRVGNWNTLMQTRQQQFHAEAALGVALAERSRVAAHEELARHLGLWGDQVTRLGASLPDRLPDLPPEPEPAGEREQQAMDQRLDLRIARADTEALARSLGLTRQTRLINVLELGPARVLEGGASDPYKNGFEISLELPLFDWSTARVARAESLYRQALDRVADQAVLSRSQVRLAYRQYRLAYDIARHHRDQLVPLRQRIADENRLRYNGMLVSVFDLLADAREQIDSVSAYLDALRDYWLAEADLRSVADGPPADATPGARS